MLRFFVLLLALAGSISAQETMLRQVFDPVTDTHVEITALFTKPSPGGYFPVRVKIANNLKVDKSIRLDFDSSAGYNDNLHTRTSFDLGAAAGKIVTTDLFVPLCPPGGYGDNNNLSLHLSGSLGEGFHNVQSSIRAMQPAVLLSEVLFTPNASTLDSEIDSKFSGYGGGGSAEFAAKFDPKQLPDNWLAFSGYDSVVMADTDWAGVPPGGRNAILSWVRLGGQLLIYAPGSPTTAELGLPAEAGFGEILVLQSSAPFSASGLVEQVTDNPNKPRQVSLQSDYRANWPLQKHFGSQTFRYTLFVIVLVIFAILVGPVNLFVFAKSGRRHRLFVTTPIISLGASLALIVIIIIQDGFGGNGMRRVLMEIRPDSGVNAAFVHQEQFCRTGVLTASAFGLSVPAAFNPVQIAQTRWARFTENEGTKGNFNLQPGDGKLQASGDWFQSRSEHGHVLSAVISTRGRIEKTDAPDTLLSTFDYPIETLYYLDDAGDWHRADGIKPGKRFALVPLDASMAELEMKELTKSFGSRNSKLLANASGRRGHFVAVTGSAPGIDTHPGIRWKETRTVITGPIVTP